MRQEAILIVDDETDVRALVAQILTNAGYLVRETRSGEEAIEAVRHDQPLLVILDVRLPGISGYEVCGWLRSRFHDSLPIIFLSG
jgi:DNA-binding response OmpR family regulator